MKREPFAVNTSPNSDPPSQVMDDLWLDESEQVPVVDTFGGSKPRRSTSGDPFGNALKDDPFGSSGYDDPFASSSSQKGPQSKQ